MPPHADIFEIHPSSGVPIYRQLVDQVHALIAGGRLQAGDMLPSVRDVAQSAAVNPMTVSKAYSKLDADGVLERVRGQGMRVVGSPTGGTLRQRRQEFRELVAPALHRAVQLGLDEDEIRKVFEGLLDELALAQQMRK
jgi:GntR family transcriptional regulator